MDFSIQKGIEYIQNEQLEDGSFYTYLSARALKFGQVNRVKTIVTPALIGSALEHVIGTEGIKSNISGYLHTQQQVTQALNYWDNAQPEFCSQPYPNDLDDTACALGVMQKPLSGRQMAAVARLLISAETQPGGPYYTWLTDDRSRWDNIDPVVNANIGYYLSKQGVELPNLTNYLERLMASNQLASVYYPNKLVVNYFVTRYYRGAYSEQLVSDMLTAYNAPLYLAMTITTIIRNGYDKENISALVNQLCSQQQDDGSWPAVSLYLHAQTNGKLIYAGSAALTTAFCLEALSLYEFQKHSKVAARIEHPVLQEINQTVKLVKSHELQTNLKGLLTSVDLFNAHRHIIDMPNLMAQAFKFAASDDAMHRLSLLSAWGWIAYTAYDDIIDGEGSTKKLPAITFCMRKMHAIIETFDKRFKDEAYAILTRIDIANAWELAHCRDHTLQNIPDYTNYWQLADRSLGHMLAGLGVLYSRHSTIASVRSFKIFFRHYLIARQLNDDAHDWEEDLARGHINAVAAILLHAQNNPSADIETLRSMLWQTEISTVNKLIMDHTRQAREAILQHKKQFNMHIFEELLTPIEAAVEKSQRERTRTLEFIRAL